MPLFISFSHKCILPTVAVVGYVTGSEWLLKTFLQQQDEFETYHVKVS